MITQFRFTEGRLKGLSSNLAFRYRAGATLGYGVKTDANNILLLDPTNPIRGPATVYTDLGLTYKGRYETNRAFGYRVQLNVRNLLNEWTLMPVKALTTGQYARYNRIAPRTYVLSTTFDF
ncbi:MAG: hypothetical protein Q7S40_26960 [Opitutaceae bacterium]|nr:hypothetical protein [Opitutaceae bacterium]